MKRGLKNLKMSTMITASTALVTAVCTLLLFLFANSNMMSAMHDTAMNNMNTTLVAKTEIIEQNVGNAEALLASYGKAPVVAELLKNSTDPALVQKAQSFTEQYFAGLDGWEGIYISDWETHVLTHSNQGAVGMTMREGDRLKQLQDAITAAGGVYNTGIMLSPASQQLVLSLYCPVFDSDGKTIIGFVGGAQVAASLKTVLDTVTTEGMEHAMNYMINVATATHIFDENADLMATEIENPMLLSVIEQINQNPDALIGNLEYRHFSILLVYSLATEVVFKYIPIQEIPSPHILADGKFGIFRIWTVSSLAYFIKVPIPAPPHIRVGCLLSHIRNNLENPFLIPIQQSKSVSYVNENIIYLFVHTTSN